MDADTSSSFSASVISTDAPALPSAQPAALRLHPVAILSIAYSALALGLYPETYLSLLAIYAQKFAIVLPMAVLAILTLLAIQRRAVSPIRFISATLWECRIRLAATVLISLIVLTAFTTLKSNIPNIVGFYADPHLAAMDELLHGGEPWRLTHRLPEATGLLVDFVYSRIWFGVIFANLLFVALMESGRRYLRYCAAMVAIFVINGTVLAVAFSSVGPIFYGEFFGPGRFVGLTETITGNAYIQTVPVYADYLLESYRSGSALLGSGISAMPSVHVSLAVLTAWYLTSLGRTAALAGWGLALFTQFGSVYTGWHYAVDGYLAAITVSLIWLGLSRYWRLPLTAGSRLSTTS
ncbi:hypothetical protein HGO38_29885 [Rhizobium sp. CG5]|uniref:phosphatase PAP2 family protein n=1 Tax=Rhizobium sp. CG5 TaxID=2726076 RepID=UPI002033A7EA|nr:phosphatase PAP2 family protein [Rhizobium sp. CG5]MCM2477663.1 hypothetical protein [Rhizobium sp. CG5]